MGGGSYGNKRTGTYSKHNLTTSYQLIRDVSMVIASHVFTDGRLHQSRERGKDVDWRVDLNSDMYDQSSTLAC